MAQFTQDLVWALAAAGVLWDRQNALHAACGSPFFSTDPAAVAAAKAGAPHRPLCTGAALCPGHLSFFSPPLPIFTAPLKPAAPAIKGRFCADAAPRDAERGDRTPAAYALRGVSWHPPGGCHAFHHFNFNRTHYYFPTTNVSGEPVQVASVACFLLSDAAAYVTGNNVEVSGGLSWVRFKLT